MEQFKKRCGQSAQCGKEAKRLCLRIVTAVIYPRQPITHLPPSVSTTLPHLRRPVASGG